MKQKWFYIIIALVVALVLIVLFIRQSSDVDNLQVIFLDIGQGDSHFIRTPGGQNILIDGGPDSTVLEKLVTYMPLQDRTIDLMILTHPHADHATGLVEVLKRYNVERVLATGVVHTTDQYLEWLEIIKDQGIKVDQATAPKQYIFETSDEPVTLDVLYPDRDVSGEEFSDLNESSVTVMLSYLDNKFLFTGDISVDVEKRIINSYCRNGGWSGSPRYARDDGEKTSSLRGGKADEAIHDAWRWGDPGSPRYARDDEGTGKRDDEGTGKRDDEGTGKRDDEGTGKRDGNCPELKANVLKVAHHGSGTSTSKEWLEAVKPEYAMIPVGENDFGHPSLRIIRRLERAGAQVLRTDEKGDIEFKVDSGGDLILL